MSLTGDTLDFVQGGVVTSSAQIVDAGATTGDVLTVQADKSIAAAPGGGSQPVTDTVVQTGAGAKLGTVIDTSGRFKVALDVLLDDVSESAGLWVLTRPSTGLFLFAGQMQGTSLATPTANTFAVSLPTESATPNWGADVDGNGKPRQFWTFFNLYDETVVLVYVNGSGGTGSSDLLTAFADPDADLDFSHDLSGVGTFQSLWSVEFVDPGLPNQPLKFDSPDGFTYRYTLATDGGGAITTTGNDIANITATDLSSWASVSATGTGDGIVEAFASTPWPSDGDDGTSAATLTAAAVIS